jgi:hypothetical protein
MLKSKVGIRSARKPTCMKVIRQSEHGFVILPRKKSPMPIFSLLEGAKKGPYEINTRADLYSGKC